MIGNVYGLRKAGSMIDDSQPTLHTTYSGTKIENELAGKVDDADLDNYYDKSEIDTALGIKANASDVYTKAQVDSSLALKADKSDTYTKAQVDSAVATKSTVSVTQDVSAGTKIGTVTVDGVGTDFYAPDSGSDVSVTPIVTTGTDIATITVDNVPTTIKAPAQVSEIDDSTTSLSKTWSSQKIDGLLILDGTSIGF